MKLDTFTQDGDTGYPNGKVLCVLFNLPKSELNEKKNSFKLIFFLFIYIDFCGHFISIYYFVPLLYTITTINLLTLTYNLFFFSAMYLVEFFAFF